jgi:hypothetical protein
VTMEKPVRDPYKGMSAADLTREVAELIKISQAARGVAPLPDTATMTMEELMAESAAHRRVIDFSEWSAKQQKE